MTEPNNNSVQLVMTGSGQITKVYPQGAKLRINGKPCNLPCRYRALDVVTAVAPDVCPVFTMVESA